MWSERNRKAGYREVQFCGQQAEKYGLEYFWVDTSCIDNSSSSEVSDTINAMYGWYGRSQRCYVYLCDVDQENGTHSSRPRYGLHEVGHYKNYLLQHSVSST